MVLARRTKLRVSKNFWGEYRFVFVEYLCNCSLKIKTKNIKNYSSILAIINHLNWLDDSPPLIAANILLPGYGFIHQDSPTNAGDVATYINNLIQYELINDLQLNIEGCKDIWIKLCESNVIVSTLYGHPKSNIDDFITALNTTYKKISNKIFYTLGYLNIDTSC